eukprot:6199086-Pleurochrysis_carterae.AAC.1
MLLVTCSHTRHPNARSRASHTRAHGPTRVRAPVLFARSGLLDAACRRSGRGRACALFDLLRQTQETRRRADGAAGRVRAPNSACAHVHAHSHAHAHAQAHPRGHLRAHPHAHPRAHPRAHARVNTRSLVAQKH